MKTKRKFSSDKPVLGKSQQKKMNPFEVHINRSKYQVLGQKLKSDQGLPGISKNKAIQKRKKTLLQEYKMKGKNNNFIDQRIGERNTNMTEDDKIMARFTAERMRMFNKKAMFNLSDSEVLTHRGQTLSEIEKFENIKSDDEDDDDARSSGALKRKFVEDAHFGGGMLTKNSKDRESLIDELINESKKRKAERQRNKEETLEATEQLDEDWKTLGMIVTGTRDAEELANTQKKDEYDVVMRQLKFEPQGQASQRLKTDEEIAKEDKEQLEKLEKERLKQLQEINANKYKNYKSADDLDDGFSYSLDGLEDNESLNVENEEDGSDSESENDGQSDQDEGSDSKSEGENEESGQEENSNSGEGSECDEEADSEKEEEELKDKTKCAKANKLKNTKRVSAQENINTQGENESEEKVSESCDEEDDLNEESDSDEECALDDLTDLMPTMTDHIESTQTTTKSKKIQKPGTETNKTDLKQDESPVELDLPYVIKVPDSFEDFKSLIGKYVPQQLSTILDRIVKSNHPTLNSENKKKMLNLAEFIIQLVIEGEVSWSTVPVLVAHFSTIKSFNREACLNLLLQSATPLFSCDTLTIPVMKFVVWYCLVFSKPEGVEMLLPISRPVLALVSKAVSQVDLAIPAQVLIGILCSYLLLQDSKTSSFLYLEPIKFLHNCVKPLKEENLSSLKHKAANNKNRSEEDTRDCVPEYLKVMFTSMENESTTFEEIQEQVLFYSLNLLSSFIKVYRKYPQSKILLQPLELSLDQIKMEKCTKLIQGEITKLKELLEVLKAAQLSALTKEAKKPKALRQYEPSFHTVTVSKSHSGPIEKREEQKLLHKYKQEKKGAMRELRRDRAFIANLKLKERVYSDEQRIKKVKEIFGHAAEQQGELRKMKRKK